MNGVHHIALASPDPVLSAEFYHRLFDLTEIRRQKEGEAVRSVWMRLMEGVLMLELSAPASSGSLPVLVFRAGDAGALSDAWLKKLSTAGIAVEKRTDFTLYFRDPGNNLIGVSGYDFSTL